MRNGQNKQRMRNRNNNNNNRRGQNPITRVYESNGPDIKIRGTASHIAEKYLQLARDARSSGDPVAAENYYQHAEHYFRLIAAAQEQLRQNQPQPRPDEMTEGGDDDSDGFSSFGQEPGFVPAHQPQPYIRDSGRDQRDNQPYHRDQQQPREQREQREREQRPQYQPQPQPVIADNGDIGRLPSFITGTQPQMGGGPAPYEGGGERERYPRRRRRHGPRPDSATQPAGPSEEVNQGGE
jgi:hypothetical protein